jgi:hypothetical protein
MALGGAGGVATRLGGVPVVIPTGRADLPFRVNDVAGGCSAGLARAIQGQAAVGGARLWLVPPVMATEYCGMVVWGSDEPVTVRLATAEEYAGDRDAFKAGIVPMQWRARFARTEGNSLGTIPWVSEVWVS